MSQSDTYTVFCIVVGEDVPSCVKIEKSKTVGWLKKLIKEERSNVFADINSYLLDLYHVDIADDDELVAKVKAHPLGGSRLPVTRLLTSIFPTTPKADTIHFIVKPRLTLGRKRPASRELNFDAKRKQLIDQLKIVTPSSATQKRVHSALGDKVDYNRPEAKRETIPIALLHQVFGVFLKDCQEHVPTHEDNRFLARLRTAMLKEYNDEATRTEAFREVFERHELKLKFTRVGNSLFLTDGDVCASGHIYFLLEGENEWHNISADPALRAFMYYIKSLKSGPYGHLPTRLPCLIIYYAGPLIGFAGVTFADKPMLEPLTPMFTFHTNPHDANASRPLTRALGAMKHAFESLQEYYTRLSTAEPNDRALFTNTEYPYCTCYTTVEGKVEFQYLQRLNPENLLFLCSKTNDTTKLCVKFTRKYSKEAHQYCADNGVAPELYAVEKLPGGWLMVVMEYLETDSYTELAALSKTARRSFEAGATAAVASLHEGGFVHGDIRDANMMVARGWDHENAVRNVKLVDFDWAGREGETTYPPNVNYWEITRPMDAKDGMPVKRSHDLEMLSYIFE